MPNVFDFRRGHSIKGVDPQAVGQELERIRAEKAALRPEDVLESASNPDSPLHNAFTWDDTEAARKFRLTEARRLIVSIRVLNSPAAKPIRAFVSVKTPGRGRAYEPTIQAMSDENLRERVLTEIREAVEAIERRYAHFAEVADLLTRMKTAVA